MCGDELWVESIWTGKNGRHAMRSPRDPSTREWIGVELVGDSQDQSLFYFLSFGEKLLGTALSVGRLVGGSVFNTNLERKFRMKELL